MKQGTALKRWRGFPLQLFVVTVLPLSALLLGIAMGGLSLHRRAMRTVVGERDERAARAAASAINEQLNHRAAAVRSLALRAAATDAPAQTLSDAEFLQPDFDGGLALFALDGTLLAATNSPDFWELNSVTESLVGIESTGDPQFVTPIHDRESDQPVVLVASRTQEGLLAVGAFFPDTMIQKILSNVFSAGDQAVAFVVDSQGQLLSQVGGTSRYGPDLSRHPGTLDAQRGESGTNYLSVGDTEIVIAFSPVVEIDWALVIEEPWQAVADPLFRATELAPLLLLPLLAVTLAGLWFGVRRIIQPLQLLEQKATELAWGDFTAIEEPVGGITEIHRLQAELIHMARKAQAAQQGLRGYLGAVTTGQEEERRRLARELHDDTIQSLIALNQRLQLAQMSDNGVTAKEMLVNLQQMTNEIITDLRRLTRALRPIYLEDLGLVPALDMLARDTSVTLGAPVEFATMGSEFRLPSEAELALYRMAQEALSNVVRHAQATYVTVQLDFADGEVSLSVEDNGRGFDVPESPAEMAPSGHYGLLGLQERAELNGGHLTIQSQPGQGTRLNITLYHKVREDS